MPIILPDDKVERLIAIRDSRRKLDDEETAILTEGYTTNSIKNNSNSPDITNIQWFIKGGLSAEPNDTFAFCFANNQDGSIPPEKKLLVEYLKLKLFPKPSFYLNRI